MNNTVFQIVEFARMLNAKVLAMLVAYFDESGTHGNSKAICISGFVGETSAWNHLEPPWKKHLSDVNVKTFHATDCENRRNEFQPLERPIREGLVNNLLNVIEDTPIFLVTSGLIVSDWNTCASDEFKRRFNSPYHFCFELTMQKIHSISRNRMNGQPIALVFAEHAEYGDYAKQLYEHYRESEYYPYLGSFSTGKPQCLIPLQVADLASNEAFHTLLLRITHDKDDNTIITARPRIERLAKKLGSQDDGLFHDCESLRQLKPRT